MEAATEVNDQQNMQNVYEYLVNHITLPRVLPQESSKNHEQHELMLLSLMFNTIEESAEWLNPATVRLFSSLKRTHMNRTSENVSKEINALRPGESFAMFVRRQNCALMIHMPMEGNNLKNTDRNTVIITTFPGNIHLNEVYNHPSDLEITYPAQALKVKFSDMMRSNEFAQQLCLLYDTLPIDRKNRNYVHKWLTTILSDKDTASVEFPSITKKIRDEVLGKSKKQQSGVKDNYNIYKSNYFRRSSFYMSIKVFLQLKVSLELGSTNGKLVYKMVMLRFMTRMCQEFEDSFYKRINVDLMTELMAKIARRIEKLSEMITEPVIEIMKGFYEDTVHHAKESLSKLRIKIDKQVNVLQTTLEQKSQLKPLTNLNFMVDVYQQVPKLRNYLKIRKCADGNENIYSNALQITSFRRHNFNQTVKPPIEVVVQLQGIELNLFLTDIENWLLYTLKFEENAFDCEILQQWSLDYASAAHVFYTSDQLGTSRMLLVRLKILAMLDRIAAQSHPLLLDHRSGIDTDLFNVLLLPQLIDMKIAYELQNYFILRNGNATDPGLIEETGVSSKSFSVKFASGNIDMQKIRREILEMGDQKIEEKEREWKDSREKVRQLRNQASLLSHEYYTYRGPYGSTETAHTWSCRLCALERRINDMNISQYVRPLPLCSIQQNAIAFELKIPIKIAVLRDILHSTTKQFSNFATTPNIKMNWITHSQASYQNKGKQRNVNLGSTIIHSVQSLHVMDNSFETFIVNNMCNCVLYASDSALNPKVSITLIKNMCTLSTESGSVYAGLQWTLNSTAHTQNQVLASQSKCPQNLALSEYKDFGSLRADGHRLQLRKLYAMIESETLSFDQSSVLSLILQSMWETGITGENGFIRESHADFDDPIFASAMIDLLKKFMELQKDDWSHPIKLLVVAFILVRVFEINSNESIADEIVAALNILRTVVMEWTIKIENALHETTNQTQSDEQSLRSLLIIVSITGAVTFFVNSRHTFFNKMFIENPLNKSTAPRMWLQSIITLNNNLLMNSSIQTNLQMMTRLVRNVGIHIEAKIQDIILQNTNDVLELIKKQWKLSEKGKFMEFYFATACNQVLVIYVEIKGITKHITIDLITGSFLVNNLPVARLPKNIINNYMYQRVFEQYVFEVQPDASNSFSTVHQYNSCSYEFGWSNNALNITEHRSNGIEMELIPPEILIDEVPELLVENYSHWWHKIDNVIHFRPRTFTNKNFFIESSIAYKLDMGTNRLIQIRTGRQMLDINSGSYTKIRDHLLRLELQKYIHVFMEEPEIAKVELTRMHLKFKIDCSISKKESCDMLSNEFSRMRVSLQQNCGTLYGLDNGLLLESVSDSFPNSKLLILPHSHVDSCCIDSHVRVTIDLSGGLLNPPFHRYEVDERLRQLKACSSNFSTWLYLAYLHAITSHGEIEPLTGMSGVERALQILQSSFIWSSAPYDNEAIRILHKIADLTPKRSMEENIQSIVWPDKCLQNSAQESFVFIANKLVADSQRLSGLYFRNDKVELKKMDNLHLNIRDYLRCLQLRPNLRVCNTIIQKHQQITDMPKTQSIDYCKNTRLVSSLYHQKAYKVPASLTLNSFLTCNGRLDGPIHEIDVFNILNHDVIVSFADLWISLYDVARKPKLNKVAFGLIWSLLAHEKQTFGPILALQAVENNAIFFENIDPPAIDSYITSEGIFTTEKVLYILRQFYKKPKNYDSEDWSDEDRNRHDDQIKLEINRYTEKVHIVWPGDEVVLYPSTSEHISIREANDKINQMLKIWNNNRKLYNFIDSVENRLRSLNSTTSILQSELIINNFREPKNWSKYEIDFEAKMCEGLNDFKPLSVVAEKIWRMESEEPNYSVKDWWSYFNEIVNSNDNKHLIDGGIYPRTVPSLILPRIANKKMNPQLKSIIGALCIAIAHEQRMDRIKSYQNLPQLKPAFDIEIANEPHINWKPNTYPEWLLFEIEQNLTIRRIQIEIAKQMIAPPNIGTRHSVMQLNMGEGKTAVIVPILAAFLADGTQACQITVLKSLFATNLKSLRQYMGGMLNRRIYTFPCRRDMPIVECIDKILDIYQECKETKGVILTLAEYRLSFQLKIYESVQKGSIETAGKFLTVHKWINSNVRSVLDESDAILHAKYQLIYTIGNQLPLDGDVKRWTIVEAILKRVPHHMRQLWMKLGPEKIEFNDKYVQNGHVYGTPKVDYRSDVFTPCRILDVSVYNNIKTLLIEDFVEGRLDIAFSEMTENVRTDLKHFLSEKQIGSATFDKVMNEKSLNERNVLLILCGLLRFEVLKLVLMKRWRVNYGVNVKGTRQMAIPFKAKDVAAELTEFGHPDVAICFTQLSYYYSGLTNKQLLRVFQLLKMNENAAEIYEKWISSVPSELVESSIQSYSGINLSDPNQRDQLLFPLFRFNMHVIDSWLSVDVFPREAKTFENKLICTAWDLCSDHMQHRVTGFSGTNDTKNILPLPISQNDLPELEQTNENVRRTLLRPENEGYEKLPANITGKMILEHLVLRNIPVLLDAGALMLEMNNEEMAREWLKLAPTIFDAAVYFDTRDVLQTIDRNGIETEFDCSVYRENLDRCLVYLDDVHTRGTDLKFPLEWKACVTICGDIARDKTVQACMRMRQLGRGHSIAFWASYEADVRIRETCNLSSSDRITNEHVIEFICKNSKRFEEENTVHWAAAAHNYTKKISAHKLHEQTIDEPSMIGLFKKCVDDEFVTLENMYGDKEEAYLIEISKTHFSALSKIYKKRPIDDFVLSIDKSVRSKLRKQAPNIKRFKHTLDEEQEKELEHELEEERQVERPPAMQPAIPEFNILLQQLFLNGTLSVLNTLISSNGIVSLSSSLLNTQLYEPYKNENYPWARNLFVTRDYIRVLNTNSYACDDFLRPVWWIGSVPILIDGSNVSILLSSFECDRLMTTFRETMVSTLFMYRPRLSKFHNNLLHERRLQVTGLEDPLQMHLKTEVEISIYAGSIYFKSEKEQDAYCRFLGLIPRPRTYELNNAFEKEIIQPNGFVPYENRNYAISISQCVGECRFLRNPVDLAVKLIIAHHQFMRKESHVGSILDRGVKSKIKDYESTTSDGKSYDHYEHDDDDKIDDQDYGIGIHDICDYDSDTGICEY